MLSIKQRHEYILDQLAKEGNIRVQDIADALGVTGATVRKDLRLLESQHRLYRNHGSASAVKQKVVDLPVQQKSFIRAAEKKRIAKAALGLITENDAIIMTSGTTIEAMAHHLTAKGVLNVVTPSLRVGVTLSEKSNVNIMMLGGHLVLNSLSVRDSYAIKGLNNVKCSKLFFSCDGFDVDAGITTAFVEEARLTDAMMRAATQSILLAESSKLGKVGFGRICDICKIDIIITDSELPEAVKTAIEDLGVEVIIA